MTHVREAVRRAAVRLWILDSLRVLAFVLTGAAAVLIVTRLVEQVFGLSHVFGPMWGTLALIAAGAVVLTTIVWTHVARKKALAVATELDDRAGLKEALSTALCLSKNEDAWARAMVETAEEKARRVDVKGAIPYALPRLWPMPIATLIGFLIVWMAVPRIDVMGLFAKKEEIAAQKREILQVKEERKADEKKLEELLKRANVEFKDEASKEGKEGDPAKELDPEAIRRAAVRDLTNLAEKLSEEKEGEKAAQMEALKEAMQQLRTPSQGPLNEFSKSLARGDFNKAQEALEQLNKQLADSSLSQEQKDQLKKQMESLAEQLKKAGDQQEQVAKKLQEQGLDKKTAQELAKKASDPEALKEAMEQMKSLTPEQMQQLLKMAKAASEACKNASSMGECMSKMAQGMSQEGMQQEGMEGMEGMQAQLSEMEMMASDMENLDAALSECKAQLAKLGNCLGGSCSGEGENPGDGMGEWAEGNSNKMGGGSGNAGQSQGGFGPEEMPTDYTQEKQKAPTQDRGGATIGTRLVYGEQVKGESRAEFADVVSAATAAATESIETGQVPREHHNAIKHYFGTLKKKGAAAPGSAPKTPDGPVQTAPDATPKK
jgi:chemotaxis protein histidine kinase CheA